MKTFENMTDEALIGRVVKRDAEAFGELYSRYYNKVFQKCVSIVKDHDDAFDLAQEALIKALNSLHTFRGDASFSTWLYIIVHRHCLEFLRKKNKQHIHPLTAKQGEALGMDDAGDDSLSQTELEKIMLALIESLPEAEKKLLLLKYSEGESIEALQHMYHLSASAVKMRLKRAKERLNHLYAIALHAGLAVALAHVHNQLV
ncbi:RNA polymerase sigma factor [Chryseolinea lacunae]|uniref:RNA polymerase sigma factor n=1 Tax=Chryseolinea lacunae TaxID=2801331 RepID=A0ABS1KVK8_9BACT|nr:RNA polymerase sigma factor [Chryseolinea lacunae]MBL0742717.1 RNA polymerase sigma factor [Chryseolinea lacunae]